MVKERQTERIGIRFTPGEARMLAELSELTGMGMTDIVRQAIRREYAERIGERPVTKKKR
ncbi:MAG: hypothetical protein ABI548_16845 [Polyangiaceae bacterium]